MLENPQLRRPKVDVPCEVVNPKALAMDPWKELAVDPFTQLDIGNLPRERPSHSSKLSEVRPALEDLQAALKRHTSLNADVRPAVQDLQAALSDVADYALLPPEALQDSIKSRLRLESPLDVVRQSSDGSEATILRPSSPSAPTPLARALPNTGLAAASHTQSSRSEAAHGRLSLTSAALKAECGSDVSTEAPALQWHQEPPCRQQRSLAFGQTHARGVFRRKLFHGELAQVQSLLEPLAEGELQKLAAKEFDWVLQSGGRLAGSERDAVDLASALTALRQILYLNGLPAIDTEAAAKLLDTGGEGVDLRTFQDALHKLLRSALVDAGSA